jgi:oxysterol-binding protein-related protein 3/6/7
LTTGELSYCLSSHNPVLRGTIPLALAALNIDYSRREFILDSGADIWHLRAPTDSEFDIWKTRLEDAWLKAKEGRKQVIQDHQDGPEVSVSSEWKQLAGLLDRLEMMKEFVHGMVLDVAQETRPGLSSKKSVDNFKELSPKPKEGKPGMKIFRKKDKSTPPSPSRELTVHAPTHGTRCEIRF